MSYENIPKNATETAVLVEVDKIVPVDVATLPDIPAKSFYFEVAAGRVTDNESLHTFGRNPTIDTADGFADLWSGGGVYTGFNATVAEPISVVSTSANDAAAGSGARFVRVVGLDTNREEITEVIVLNGTTPVISANSYIRCSLASVLQAGTLGGNDGIITGNQSVTVANVFFVMEVGDNRTLQSVYTIPANKQLLLVSIFTFLAKKGSSSAEVKILIRGLGGVFQTVTWFALDSNGTSYVPRQFDVPFQPLPAGADIKFAASVSANNTAVAAGIEGILETLPV